MRSGAYYLAVMSSEPTPVTAAHLAYIAERTAGDDAFLTELKLAAREAQIPEIQISPEQASLMQILLRLREARRIVEVGTLAGYSAITMARALPPGGVVHTVELEPRFAEFAEDWIRRSDVADKIVVHRGAGRDLLPRFETASADAAFLDADKGSYTAYLDECLRIVRRNGLIMADNAFAFGQLFDENPSDAEAPAMKAFNDHMASVEGLHSIIVPVGDGLWIGVKTD